MNSSSDFFVVGGSVELDNKSYVSRPADEDLYNQIISGYFCYILTPRQMGKSSLMVRTAGRLEEVGWRTVQIDLTGIGTGISADAWYQGLLIRLTMDLKLEIDIPAWWTERAGMPIPQRFIEFLHKIVLAQVDESIAIFIDEIDSTLDLDFSDDFFAAIRFTYNERAKNPIYNRLTFVLLGVATPNDLMKDTKRTPFNIGRRIELHEFSRNDAQVLANGLDNYWNGQGDKILNYIFDWTNGHPYLTQKLCEAAANAEVAQWTEVQVDELVKNNFLSDLGRDDSNLKTIQRNIKAKPTSERRRLLSLYQKVYTGRIIRSNPRSSIQNYLILIGLVREKNTQLHLRNEIYRQVFGPDWIKEYMPANIEQRVAILTSLVALIMMSLFIFFIWTRQRPPNIQAQVCKDNFTESKSPTVRIDALACLFDLGPGYDEDARELFYSLSSTDQKYLFLLDDPQTVGSQLISVVKGIYVTLDQMEGNHDQVLLEAMLRALEESNQSEARRLIREIEAWKRGRELSDQQQYAEAVISYTLAIEVNQDDTHPVVHYDRAMAYVALRQYGDALADLERMVIIARMAPPTPTPTKPLGTSTPTATSTPTSTPTPIDTPILGPTDVRNPIIPLTPFAPPSTSPNLITATQEPTPSNVTINPRFLNADQIIKTVSHTINQTIELQDYLQQNQADYPQLAAILGYRRVAAAPTCIAIAPLNLRSGPGVAYEPPIMIISEGTKLIPLGFSPTGYPDGQWILVQEPTDNRIGWTPIDPQFVNCEADLTALPVVAVPSTPIPTNTPTPTATVFPTLVGGMATPPTPTSTSTPTATVFPTLVGETAMPPTSPSILTSTPTSAPRPATIVYVQSNGLNHVLGIISSEGKFFTQSLHPLASAPAWSPDGTRIAFYGEPGLNGLGGVYAQGSGIWFFEIKPGTVRLLYPTEHIKNMAWSPDGIKLAAEIGPPNVPHQIFVVDTRDGKEISRFPGEQPAWSPDSQELVIKSCAPECGLWKVGFDGSEGKLLTNDSTDSYPNWSLTGPYIVFTSRFRTGDWEIYRLNIDNGILGQLTSRPGSDTTPVFSPDGVEIYFRTDAFGDWQLRVMAGDGSNERTLIDDVGPSDDWGLARPAIY